MILFKDGIQRRIEDLDTIKIFKEAGWRELPEELVELTKKEEPITKKEEPVKKATKKTIKKTK